MYVGRFLVVGPEGGAYRVSSRSFPNRRIADRDGTLTVGPTADAPPTENPYVSYNCVRLVARSSAGTPATSAGEDGPDADTAVLGNGSHVDPIAEKLTLGYPPRDALAAGLLALDFEKDDYDTPRIAGTVTHPDVAGPTGDAGAGRDADVQPRAYVGTVRRDALVVRAVAEPTLVATYERDEPAPTELPVGDAAAAARAAYDADYEHAVCAAGVAPADAGGFETAFVNGAGE